MAANLQNLAKEIDEDFQKIKGTPFGRRGIYYTVFIDEKQTSITARKTTRISYLIDTKQKGNTYTRLYIEDWQIGVILAGLNDSSFNYVKSWLVAVYNGKSVEEHRVKLFRPALHSGIEEMSSESLLDIIYLGDISTLPSKVDTTFGFSVSSRSFIDFLCLTLSMEDSNKLRIELTKHCMLADLLKKQNEAIIYAILPQLKVVKTTVDVERLYTNINSQQKVENYDKAIFSEQVSKQYFESLASKL